MNTHLFVFYFEACSHDSSRFALQMTNSQFSDLDVSKATHAAISDVLGYDKMTKVQEQSIPVCLSGECDFFNFSPTY